MVFKWKRESVEKLIICLQQHPCLFNIKSSDYLDRIKKAQAWNNIVEELVVNDSSLNVQEVKRKWRNLRVQFMQEQRLTNNTKKSGAGVSDIYIPKLWCYEQLCFLKMHTEVRTSKDNIETTSPENPISDTGGEENFSQEHHLSEEPLKKKPKNTIKCFREDLNSFKNILSGKKEKKFAWLANLVATQMEEIRPEDQDDAAWEVQCLMRRLTSKSLQNSTFTSSPEDILELSIEELFDEEFSTSE